MNMTTVMLGARKPRSDIVQFLLSTGFEHSVDKDNQLISLDVLLHYYMLFGPEHSERFPFAVEEDLASALVWLQRNGYLFLAGDDSLTVNRALGISGPRTARVLCEALEASAARLQQGVKASFA